MSLLHTKDGPARKLVVLFSEMACSVVATPETSWPAQLGKVAEALQEKRNGMNAVIKKAEHAIFYAVHAANLDKPAGCERKTGFPVLDDVFVDPAFPLILFRKLICLTVHSLD
jgi:hypothetical protein